MRISPGFCSAQYGAVPATDWRDKTRYGPTNMAIGLRLQRDGVVFKVRISARTMLLLVQPCLLFVLAVVAICECDPLLALDTSSQGVMFLDIWPTVQTTQWRWSRRGGSRAMPALFCFLGILLRMPSPSSTL
jgi:hypothetical protein